MTWATRITILRLILVPVFVVFIITYSGSNHREEAWRYAAIGVFVVASVSDAIDGYLARHWNQASALGALLDPIADKLLLFAALVTLSIIPVGGHLRPFPIWFPAIIISRDALLLGGYSVLRHFHVPVDVRPHWTGKASTFFTLLAIGAVLFKLGDVPVEILCAAGAGFALVCTIIYVRQGLNLLTHSGHTVAQAQAKPLSNEKTAQNSQAIAYLIPQLERLMALPLQTEPDLEIWNIERISLEKTLQAKFPNFEPSDNFWHFMADADIRSRDKDYLKKQHRLMSLYITRLQDQTRTDSI